MVLPSSAWAATICGSSIRMSGTTTEAMAKQFHHIDGHCQRSALARGASCTKPSGLAICIPSTTATAWRPSRRAKCCSVTCARVPPMPHARLAGETSPSPTLPPARPTPPLSRPGRKASAASARGACERWERYTYFILAVSHGPRSHGVACRWDHQSFLGRIFWVKAGKCQPVFPQAEKCQQVP